MNFIAKPSRTELAALQPEIESDSKPCGAEKRVRVLRVSHASLTPALRERERTLVRRFPEIDLEVLTAERWHEGALEVEAIPDDLFPVTRSQTYLTNRIPLFVYDPRPLVTVLRRHQPHLIDLSQEPYSIACAEVITLCRYFAPQARIVIATAQNILRRFPFPFQLLEQRAYAAAAAAYACSRTVREVLRAKGFWKPVPIIPFGVDLNLFRPRQMKADASAPLKIGFVGRMIAAKGLAVLISALAQIADLPWQLLLIGDGPERKGLEQRLAQYGLIQRAHIAGAVPYDQLPAYYQQMDLCVMPTQTTARVREQFGRVLIEAMASGVCVIGSTSGAIPEVIGDAGLVFPEGDAVALAAVLRRVLTDDQLRHTLAQAGRRRVEQHYTWDHVAEQMYALYRQVLRNF